MLIYKIFRADEWQALQEAGQTAGAPIDRADGYVHFSTAAQAAETAARHFAGEDGLVLLAVDADALGDALKWEVSRGGARFPHLYRTLRLDDVQWARPLPLSHGAHVFPGGHGVNLLEQVGLPLLRGLDPETAHGLALSALQLGAAPAPGLITSARLRTTLAGLPLANPLGLAAGFDKNAEALLGLSRAGFGFFEVGAVTPRPQPGNPRPRLFRLTEDRAAINRFGFNNKGMEAAAARLAKRPRDAVIGLNLGANKDSDDRAADYATVLAHCAPHLDFATVNVSSPNTERLRDLQGPEALAALLSGVMAVRDGLARPLPVFLKIAPDLTEAEIAAVASVAAEAGVDAIIATNTTLDRTGLKSRHAQQAGGLSGAPLFERSTRVLAQLSAATGGAMPLVGVGGVSSADTAYAKIRAGATAVQLYTALVYGGMSLVGDILRGLDRLLEQDGFANVAEAVGTGRKDWL